jgi:glutamate formiminotransferase
VTTWRTLQRMGAALLTPGAAAVPYSEDLLEQTEWLAERIVESGGEAWVLPVTDLRERDEAEIRARLRSAREQEYEDLRAKAARPLTNRGVVALEHGYRSVVARDHFRAAGRGRARRAIDKARALTVR